MTRKFIPLGIFIFFALLSIAAFLVAQSKAIDCHRNPTPYTFENGHFPVEQITAVRLDDGNLGIVALVSDPDHYPRNEHNPKPAIIDTPELFHWDGNAWKPISDPLFSDTRVTMITANRMTNTIYAGLQGPTDTGSLIKSDDGGITWYPLPGWSEHATDPPHGIFISSDGYLIVDSDSSIQFSKDGGDHWDYLPTPPLENHEIALVHDVSLVSPGMILIVIQDRLPIVCVGCEQPRFDLYLTEDWGESWTGPLEGFDVPVFDPLHPDEIHEFGVDDLYTSSIQIPTRDPAYWATVLKWHCGLADYDILFSTNGKRWRSTQPPSEAMHMADSAHYISMWAIDGNTAVFGTPRHAVLLTEDRGKTWQTLESGIPLRDSGQ